MMEVSTLLTYYRGGGGVIPTIAILGGSTIHAIFKDFKGVWFLQSLALRLMDPSPVFVFDTFPSLNSIPC